MFSGFMFNKPIYNKNGIIKDYSDEGLEKEKIESEANLFWLLKRLKPRQREIIELKMAGYNQKEIADKLKLSEKTIQREMSVLRGLISIMK